MGENILEVKNISKLYRLGKIGTGSLRQDLNYWWTTSVLKKENPFFQMAGVDATKTANQFLWALKDVGFEMKQGETLGIIGPNGSGKSTLLKIISRIVRPTTGTVKGRGKVSSLLEVGTGFSAELTGRENIYVSGYILGMTKSEIKDKFDEILAFSGIEKFIDTPVKRYSSGMYVRLAFAVAAHLEPDILIVDEVLAVGDAEFQKKCLGKMREVSQSEGRTILFVSHSMQAVMNLCDQAMWLQNGKKKDYGEVSHIVNKYIAGIQQHQLKQQWDTLETGPGNDFIRFKSVELVPHLTNPGDPLDIRIPLTFKFSLWNRYDNVLLSCGFHLFSYSGECIFDIPSSATTFNKGVVEGECTIPGNLLNDGSYFISLIILKDSSFQLYYFEECLSFEVEDYREEEMKYFGKWVGSVRPKLPFHLSKAKEI